MKPKVVRAMKADLASTEEFIELEMQRMGTVTVSEVNEAQSKSQSQAGSKEQSQSKEQEEQQKEQ